MMLDKEIKVGLCKTLLLARVFEEKKIELAPEIGKVDIGPTSCYGQEAIPVGFCYGLNKDDFVLPSIRSAWSADIAKGVPVRRIAAEMYGREGGFSKGRELSSHITILELGLIGGTGILNNHLTVGAGIGLAARIRRTNQVAVCFSGDGASNREEFFTALNFAALKKLPVIFVVESNLIAELTPIEKVMPIKNIADRALAFGIPGVIVDGNDVMAVYEISRSAFARARRGEGPTLVECKTCRVRPMSEMKKNERGLPAALIEEWTAKDPVKRMKAHLLETGILTQDEINRIQETFQKEVDEAFRFAREDRYAPPQDVFADVYAKGVVVE
jgi:acetoin:2,6-dichlorophenolindophenol oxidoreductase subunit alpha